MSQHNDEKNALIDMSCWAGSRFDWVQAAGGNTSIKTSDSTMLVKASGIHLSDIGNTHGLVCVNHQALWASVKKHIRSPSWETRHEEKQLLDASVLDTVFVKPSIETVMHACLGKVVLHSHPLMLNALTCRQDWETRVSAIIPDAIMVPYVTPGLPLAIAISERIAGRENDPLVIVLQNHGLVVSGPNTAWVRQTTRDLSDRLSDATGFQDDRQVQDFWQMAHALHPTMIWASRDRHIVTALSQDLLWDCPAFLPDLAVFGADHVLRVSEDMSALRTYWCTHGTLPKVVLFQNRVLILAPTLTQARHIEDVLASKIILLNTGPLSDIVPLDRSEIHRLLGWDAEAYRQKRAQQ